MFNAGPSDGEAIGSYRGDPLYHASLGPAEYAELLAGIGFELLHVAEDAQARRTDGACACAELTRASTASTQGHLFKTMAIRAGRQSGRLAKGAENELVSTNPTASAIPVIDRAGSTSKVLARSMRRPT